MIQRYEASVQKAMRRSCEARDYAELANAVPKARGLASRVIKLNSHRPSEIWREYDEALYVENGSIFQRSGTVMNTR